MDLFSEFIGAVRRGDAKAAAGLLDAHPEWVAQLDQPFAGASFGQTPILAAVASRSRETVDVLLRAGAHINARSHWWAGGFGVLDDAGDLADFLIERGATVDAGAAARLGRLDLLRELVERDPAAAGFRGGDGQTPLHVAANLEIAAYLVEHGADIDALDVDHESTPAQYLIREHPEIVRFLVARGCRTDLLMAAALGDRTLVERHLDAAPDSIRMTVTARYFPMRNPHAGGSIYIWTLGSFQTAHTIAHEFGHPGVVELLMERSPSDWQLAMACETGDEVRMVKLLAEGAKPALESARRLPDAARRNRTEAVDRLLSAGWPVDARGDMSATALHWAAWHGNIAMVTRLLQSGAPRDAVEPTYQGTALAWAKHGENNGWYRATGDYPAVIAALSAG